VGLGGHRHRARGARRRCHQRARLCRHRGVTVEGNVNPLQPPPGGTGGPRWHRRCMCPRLPQVDRIDDVISLVMQGRVTEAAALAWEYDEARENPDGVGWDYLAEGVGAR
jgi:hypothetical protein